MRNRTGYTIASALIVAVAVLVSTGCVTKKAFRRNVEETDTRVGGIEDAVEANERRLRDVKAETDEKIASTRGTAEEALNRGERAITQAQQAERLAEEARRGRLLWTVALTDEKVKFDFGKARLSPEATEMLDQLVSDIRGYGKAVYVEIEGHTDATGSEQLNESLGERRAQAVRDYLAKAGGIPLHAMNVISYGESQPVAENDTRQGRAQNRRVVVRVLE